ncbi:MAG: hypothetical protein MUF19_03510 [Candidatus Pacebacteria bacterium]|jgi:hypothetical protein|nr:hypothetical protein [Candidatus Paceibacterota bacterium]
MRHLIVLSGNSPKNKAWGELMLEHYSAQFDSSFMLSYDHWENGAGNIDFAREEEKLCAHVSSLPAGTEVILFAKSAGSLLAFLAVSHQAVMPARCVFFGIPFDLAADLQFKEAWESVSSFAIPALAFHNIEDPTTSYEFTKDILTKYAPRITLITTNESDHWYGDTSSYDTIINSFLE